MSSSQLSSAASPLSDSVSPLLWGAAAPMPRSNPIAIVGSAVDSDDEESSDSDEVVPSLQRLALDDDDNDTSFRVGSLPSSRRRREQQHRILGTSLPAAPLLRSRNRSNAPSIPPIALTEHDAQNESPPSPSYGSLRESHISGRFLDGPASYRERSSGQIKWMKHSSKVRFQPASYQDSFLMPKRTPGERMQELREMAQQGDGTPRSDDEPSSLSTMLSSQEAAPQEEQREENPTHSNNNDFLSTSLTGLEILQRGLHGEAPPDAANLSSWSSSGANTLDAAAVAQEPEELLPPPHYDDDDDDDDDDDNSIQDDGPVFDLDME